MFNNKTYLYILVLIKKTIDYNKTQSVLLLLLLGARTF